MQTSSVCKNRYKVIITNRGYYVNRINSNLNLTAGVIFIASSQYMSAGKGI